MFELSEEYSNMLEKGKYLSIVLGKSLKKVFHFNIFSLSTAEVSNPKTKIIEPT